MSGLDELRHRRRKAPARLLPRVMAAVAAEEAKPWWKRQWWAWPVAARAAYVLSVAVGAGLVAAGALQAAAPAQAALSQAQAAAQAAWTVTAALWRLGGAPLQVLTAAMAVSCAAFAAGLARLLEPAPRTI